MALLVSCPSCSRPHARTETTCPFCSATVVSRRGSSLKAGLGVMALGLSLTGCVDDGESMTTTTTTATDGVESDSWGEATYGVPMTTTGDEDESTSSSGGTSSSGSTGGSSESSSSGGTDGLDTDTDTDTDGGSSTSG